MNHRTTIFSLIIVILFTGSILSQPITYQGPSTGSISGGVMVTTDNFSKVPPLNAPEKERIVKDIIKINDNPPYLLPPTEAELAIYQEDVNAGKKGGGGQTLLLQSFPGIPMTNSIPPDPHIAVGPNHILATVNSRFAIWDKEGNLLKNIDADQWYATTLPGPGAFDPQIIYDHYEGRWFMLWDSQNDAQLNGHFLISISDDDDPLGVWYNYALPAHQLGSTTVTQWGDYPQVGFDDEAIYIDSRQVQYGGDIIYDRIRILNKAEYYSANGGPVTFTDIWNISYPGSSQTPDVIHPVFMYSEADEYYFLHTMRTGGVNMYLYRLTNPLTNPVLTAVTIPVTPYAFAPNANQLGNGSPLIESNGSHIKTAPIYRDGYIWYTHSLRNPTQINTTSLRYGKLDVSSNTVVEEVTFGAQDHWYIYPTIAVDKDHNIAITYTRTSLTEYAGAFYSTKLADDPPSLSGSFLLKEGEGNYVVAFGGRNRWGDYMGIFLDPVTESNVWMFTEYAAGTNTWGTWVGEIRMVPFPGTHMIANIDSLEFKSTEINFSSDTLSFILANLGEDAVNITAIPDSVGPFKLLSQISTPVVLDSYDSLLIQLYFNPTIPGVYEEIFTVTSNDPDFQGVKLKARGYTINPAELNKLYASSGLNNDGQILEIDRQTGAGTLIGPSLFNEIKSITIHPDTRVMYGLVSLSMEAQIVRINAEDGDAYHLFTLPIGLMQGIAFDTLGTLYGVTRPGEIYLIDLENQTASQLSNASTSINCIAVNPLTNELWASAFAIVGSNRDLVFKINKGTGDTTIVGHTGLNMVNNGLAFDDNGNLFAVVGAGANVNDLISIDTTTASGTVIGSIGYPSITGLAFIGGEPNAVDDEDYTVPNVYSLSQNYPNPFNPVTTIEFSLPFVSNVKLTVYNLLGEVVNVLVNREMNAGNHKINWNAEKLSSGIYFLEMKASGVNGSEFTDMKKMILLK